MSALPSLCVGTRSESPAQAQALFHVEDLPHLLFCAHAVEEGGAVIIQQVCCLHDLQVAWVSWNPSLPGHPHAAVVPHTTP
jgi:hypothetical protein